MLLYFYKSFAGVLIDGGKEEEELLHTVLGVHVEGDQPRVEQTLHQQPIFDVGHVVPVQQFVLHTATNIP